MKYSMMIVPLVSVAEVRAPFTLLRQATNLL